VQNVIITPHIGQALTEILSNKAHSKIGVLLDENTEKHCYPIIKDLLGSHEVIKVDAGEKFKTLDTCTAIWNELTLKGFDRHSVLVVIGGGVLGDMGGFCAATFKRGIEFILVPTTLLSQVDASVGGKLGIDFMGFLNHIGVFKQPTATLISSQFLKTLPPRELRSGFAEVIKHCLIASEPRWQAITSQDLNGQKWDELIGFSCKVKSDITEKDPYEEGVRKVLNLGHTLGHAIESCTLKTNQPLFHGEAIAVGIITEGHISVQKGLLKAEMLKEISGYIISIFGKEVLPASDQIMELIIQDKKNKGNKILMALLETVGHVKWDVEVNESEIRNSLDYYGSL
jgi:3-dehydroquinate synthase